MSLIFQQNKKIFSIFFLFQFSFSFFFFNKSIDRLFSTIMEVFWAWNQKMTFAKSRIFQMKKQAESKISIQSSQFLLGKFFLGKINQINEIRKRHPRFVRGNKKIHHSSTQMIIFKINYSGLTMQIVGTTTMTVTTTTAVTISVRILGISTYSKIFSNFPPDSRTRKQNLIREEGEKKKNLRWKFRSSLNLNGKISQPLRTMTVYSIQVPAARIFAKNF